jgi:hypothetical protein
MCSDSFSISNFCSKNSSCLQCRHSKEPLNLRKNWQRNSVVELWVLEIKSLGVMMKMRVQNTIKLFQTYGKNMRRNWQDRMLKWNKYLLLNPSCFLCFLLLYVFQLIYQFYWQDKEKQKDLSVPGAGVSILFTSCSAYFVLFLQVNDDSHCISISHITFSCSLTSMESYLRVLSHICLCT